MLLRVTTLLPEFFRRLDDGPDEIFYGRPRSGEHLDDEAAARARDLYGDLLPIGGSILDLMAGKRSHLPDRFDRVVGLGLNLDELRANRLVDEPVIFDVNTEGRLPFTEGEFDGAVCTASVQYMTRPCDTFADVARALRSHAPFVVTFSTRMFPSKAVLAWRASDDAAHVRLVRSYFAHSGGFGATRESCFLPTAGDPLYAVWAYRNTESAVQSTSH